MRPLLDKLTIRGPQSPQWVVRSPRPLPKYQIAKPLVTDPNCIHDRVARNRWNLSAKLRQSLRELYLIGAQPIRDTPRHSIDTLAIGHI